MEASIEPSAIRRIIWRREIALWLSAFGWPALRVLMLGAALGIALVALASQWIDPGGDEMSTADVIEHGVGYGLLLALTPAIWAGLSSLALRLARGWAVVPALTLPVYIAIACWLRADALRGAMSAVSDAIDERLDVTGVDALRDLSTSGADAALGSDMPALIERAGDSLFAGPIGAALSSLETEVGITLIAALVPGVLVSIVALSVGYRRGWAERHEADLEKLRRAEASG